MTPDKAIGPRNPKSSLFFMTAAFLGGALFCFAVGGMNERFFPPRRSADGGGLFGAGRRKALKIINLKIVGREAAEAAKTPRFKRTDKITLSYGAANLFAVRVKNKKSPIIHIRQDLAVRDKKGAIVFIKPAILDIEKPLDEGPAKFINEITLGAIKDLPAGNYEICVLLTDLVGFQTTADKLTVELR